MTSADGGAVVVASGGARAELDAARHRRLLRLAGPAGIVAGLALDHRDSFRNAVARRGLRARTTEELGRLKLELVRALAPGATCLMLDAELGGPTLASGVVPPSVGLLMPLEAQGYEDQGDHRLSSLLDDFSPLDALRLGADACKLLLPYRVDDEAAAAHQDGLVAGAVDACHAAGLPLVVEPVVHRLSTEADAAHAAAYPSLVIDAVARIRPLGADLLKLPFPVHRAPDAPPAEVRSACRALADACGATPWVLLGGGEDDEALVARVRAASEAGASGFLAGRAIWGPVLRDDPEETGRLAADVAGPAFARLRAVAESAGRPLAAVVGG